MLNSHAALLGVDVKEIVPELFPSISRVNTGEHYWVKLGDEELLVTSSPVNKGSKTHGTLLTLMRSVSKVSINNIQ